MPRWPQDIADPDVLRAAVRLLSVLEILEQKSADDVRIHLIYERIQSAYNSLLHVGEHTP